MWFLIKTAFWFTVVLVMLPFFDGDANDKLSNQPQVQAGQAISAASGAIAYASKICADRPDVCENGIQTISALGSRAREGALVAYKLLDQKFGAGAQAEATKVAVEKTASITLPADIKQALPRPLPPAEVKAETKTEITGSIIPIPLARPKH